MTDYLCKHHPRRSRKTIGILGSLTGVGLNLLLFALKGTAGMLSGSVAVTADGFGNLGDAGSCILALLGFTLGDLRPTKRYPLGYGRVEYLSGLLISAAILSIGARMAATSLDRILHPQAVDNCPVMIGALAASILIKTFMYRYYRHIDRQINSAGMRAAALDSLADVISTAAILAATAAGQIWRIHIDGYTGMVVAGCILYTGIIAARDGLRPLLGRQADEEILSNLQEIAAACHGIRKIGDIALHDCGPHRKLLTMTVVSEDSGESIQALIREVKSRLGMEAYIKPEEKEIKPRQNNPPLPRQEYGQTIQNQEREEIER